MLINLMIFAGSALMVYNILRYGSFMKAAVSLERRTERRGMLVVPLLLLIFFLVGYLTVGLTGIGTLLIAGILFGGSVFVFLLLSVMMTIFSHMRTTDQVLSIRYREMLAELESLGEDSLAAFLVNLTKDEVEERAGLDLYACDPDLISYTELFRMRLGRIVDSLGSNPDIFEREELLRRYRDGQTHVSSVLLQRRESGEIAYVRVEAALSTLPVSGEVVAFITEQRHNEEIVRRTVLERVLMDQYDRVAYLIDGKYRVLISNAGKKAGLLFPDDEGDSYESLYLNYILPAQPKDREKPAGPNPLRLSVIDKALEERDVYEVNAPFVIEGELRYKRIVFYRINRDAKFYLFLISDSTAVQEEQIARNRVLTEALETAVLGNRARTRFFTRISHDLRTPLNAVLGFTGLAKTEEDRQKRLNYLEKTEAAGHALLEEIENLFDLSLIESGEFRLDERETDLCALAESLRRRFETESSDKELSLVLDLDGVRHPRVICDERRLSRSLGRLLGNAYAYAPEKTAVTLRIRQDEAADGRCRTELSVLNQGADIPAEALEHIFDPEAWDEHGKTGELTGAGTGMAVIRAFAEKMGGSVVARSDGEGNEDFSILLELPVVCLSEPEAAEAAAAEQSLHILLVDDNPINRELGELLLTAEGWTVEQAENGAQAVEMVERSGPGHFDLVLMDVQMPVMNGYEATRRIRALADPALASIPILAVTANAYQEDVDTAMAAGMNGYVAKPIDPAALRREIDRLFPARSAAADGAQS